MDHFVVLDRLPDGLEFPPDLRDRIAYSPESRRLGFKGFMSKADFDRLWMLSEDWSFRHKLEDLFRICTVEPDPPRGLRRWLGPLFGGAAVHPRP
jgi:hypothetical protein